MRWLKSYLPVLVWLLVIFGASTEAGSPRRTSRFIGPVLRWFNPSISPEAVRSIQLGIRKTAHIVEYAILAALAWYGRGRFRGSYRQWDWREARNVLLFCAVYAMTDEAHQLFVSSRGASLLDVLLDTAGAAGGLLGIWYLGQFRGLWGVNRAENGR